MSEGNGPASAQILGIVGCGRMGSALAHAFAASHMPMFVTSRRGHSAAALAELLPGTHALPLERLAVEADIIVLATPIAATFLEVAPRIRGTVVGKPVIDLSNPGFDRLPRESGADSAGELLACALPGSGVVKALNCLSARQVVHVAKQSGSGPAPTVPIAGDDVQAKRAVRSILERAGFDVADAGDLRGSRLIEGLAELLMRVGKETGDTVGFRLVGSPGGSAKTAETASVFD